MEDFYRASKRSMINKSTELASYYLKKIFVWTYLSFCIKKNFGIGVCSGNACKTIFNLGCPIHFIGKLFFLFRFIWGGKELQEEKREILVINWKIAKYSTTLENVVLHNTTWLLLLYIYVLSIMLINVHPWKPKIPTFCTGKQKSLGVCREFFIFYLL